MIARLVRISLGCLYLASLLVCTGSIWLWHRSLAGQGDRMSLRAAGKRWTATFDAGRLVLSGPPPSPASGDAVDKARRLAIAMQNGDVHAITNGLYERYSVVPDAGTPTEALLWLPPRDTAAALLDALEDPARFLAAHVVLCEGPSMFAGFPSISVEGAEGGRPSTTLPVTYTGLRGRLRPERDVVQGQRPEDRYVPPGMPWSEVRMDLVPDAGQLPRVRDHWHSRLDVVLWSMRLSWVFCATAAPPLIYATLRARRAAVMRRRRRHGLCLHCGYDLRGSAGRCSECGAARPGAAAAGGAASSASASA